MSPEHQLRARSRHRLIWLISVLATIPVVAVVIVLVRPLPYRDDLPAAWGEECLGGPAVIDNAFTEAQYSRADIQYREAREQQSYSCSWTSKDDSQYTIDFDVSILDGSEFDSLDVDIQGVRDSDTESLEAEDIVGFDSGYCTSEINVEQFRCYAVDSNLKVKIMVTGGGSDGMPPGLEVSLEDFLVEVGADVRNQLAK